MESDRRNRVSQEAATWWVRLQADQISGRDREEFVDWLSDSAFHCAEMLRMAQLHRALMQFQAWTEIAAECSDETQKGASLAS
jgi:ferric-dicitrate binding protein FerR (iron transport regulator)